MSRRPVFLIALTVVLLYFSSILFMLTPLHGAGSAYFRNNYLHQFSLKNIPAIKWCKDLHWRAPPGSVTALVSFPGSGNTWMRYLLQQVTGIMTGSIYMDHGLRNHGFPAENITDGSVLVVKTHEAPPIEADRFKSAVLLIRNPRDAILADFNRLHKGHIGTAPASAFKRKSKKSNKTEWEGYVQSQTRAWGALHRTWLQIFSGPVLVVRYERLCDDTRATLQTVLDFLNFTVTQGDMNCAIVNKEGIYRRKKKIEAFDPFTPEMYQELGKTMASVLSLITQYYIKHNQTYN